MVVGVVAVNAKVKRRIVRILIAHLKFLVHAAVLVLSDLVLF